MASPRIARLTVYPVKSLDPLDVERATVESRGRLALDREYALFDADGGYVNGKATARVHRLRSAFDPETHEVTLWEGSRTDRTDGGPADARTFDLRDDHADAEAWLSDFFDREVTVRRNGEGGYPDDTALSGPTVISTATIEEVASWFEGVDPAGMRRRLRANVEVDGVPAFWEDRLFGDHGEVVAFEAGDVTLHGVNPCQRCVVPSRDPDTGEEYEGFRERFVEKRRETLPSWTPSDRFDHDFRLMLNTVVPEPEWGTELRVGDGVRVLGTRSVDGV